MAVRARAGLAAGARAHVVPRSAARLQPRLCAPARVAAGGESTGAAAASRAHGGGHGARHRGRGLRRSPRLPDRVRAAAPPARDVPAVRGPVLAGGRGWPARLARDAHARVAPALRTGRGARGGRLPPGALGGRLLRGRCGRGPVRGRAPLAGRRGRPAGGRARDLRIALGGHALPRPRAAVRPAARPAHVTGGLRRVHHPSAGARRARVRGASAARPGGAALPAGPRGGDRRVVRLGGASPRPGSRSPPRGPGRRRCTWSPRRSGRRGGAARGRAFRSGGRPSSPAGGRARSRRH